MVSQRPFSQPKQEPQISDLVQGIDREPPFSLEVENGFISGLLAQPELRVDEAMQTTPPEAFYIYASRTIYETIIELWTKGTPLNIGTLTHRLREMEVIDKVGGAGEISRLYSFIPINAEFEFFRKVLHEKWLLRDQIRASLKAVHRCYRYGTGNDQRDINEVLDECESETRQVRDKSNAGGFRTISELCMEAQDDFERQIDIASHLVLDADGRAPIPGLSTGIPALDDMTLGLCEGHPWMILAATSDGKTSLASQIALFSAVESRDPVPVCYYLTESSTNDWLKRAWSYLSGVDLGRIMRGTVIPEETGKVTQSVSRLARSPFILRHLPGLTDVALETDMRYMRRKFGVRLFAVDYIQRIRLTQRQFGQNDADALAEFSQRIADATATMKATTMVLSQLNDDGKIAKSKAMAWDAEIAFTISRPLKSGQQDKVVGNRILKGERDEKSRDLSFHKARMTGERGNRLNLLFDGARQRFR